MDRMSSHYSLESLDEVTSTQEVVRDRAPRSPHVVVAKRQTAGRGRRGRGWETAPRAVAVSVGWETTAPRTGVFPLLAGVAAQRVVGGSLKWPNDVMRGDDKVGGILAERSGDLVIIGLGLNLWWPDAPAARTAIWESQPEDDAGVDLATSWVENLLALVEEDPWPRLDYLAVCSTIGREIIWEPGGRGRAVDVTDEGALLVETTTGPTELHSGEVHHIRTV